ncbi:hypothetical protein BRADI_5g01193v3 [Brachypodium distachyon]|uniref:Uncharacterized protein n=1 Tax=Brachypodium distachyon TaxID=15368 RepID=A0A0Q3E140_BRADI|nr:hypothetical protein BRADI_5g01193v3 [Brachypodium distachyon]
MVDLQKRVAKGTYIRAEVSRGVTHRIVVDSDGGGHSSDRERQRPCRHFERLVASTNLEHERRGRRPDPRRELHGHLGCVLVHQHVGAAAAAPRALLARVDGSEMIAR